MKRVVLGAMLISVSGCGAVLHGTRQNIDVQSSPASAKVETSPSSGIYSTPTTLNLERKNSYVLTFTSPGYEPATFNIHNGIGTGTVVADVLLTGLVGVVVDGLSGAWYGLDPEAASVTLVRPGGSPSDADAIHIAIANGKGGHGLAIAPSVAGVRVQVARQR